MTSKSARDIPELTDESEQAQDTAKHLDNEDFDEEIRVGGICEGGGRASDTDRDPTEEVAHADSQPSPKECIT